MGKTKTAVISGIPDKDLSGADKYKLKQKKRKEAESKTFGKKGKGAVSGVGLKGGERIKVVGADIPEKQGKEETPDEKEQSLKRKPKQRGSKYKKAVKQVEKTKLYEIKEAVKLVKSTSYSKFNGSVELHITVIKQGLSRTFSLPHQTGKKKVIEVANDKTIDKLKDGKIDYDVLLATPSMMQKLVPFARLLGPKGLMPNPKNKTLIKTNADAKKYSASSTTIKTERKAPLIHCVVGKVDQKIIELEQNIEAVLNEIGKKQLTKATLTSTMGPGIKLQI